jgi:small conductance mechanosensitive channel
MSRSYLLNIIGVTLRIILVVALLGFFGIETTSFAALLPVLLTPPVAN